MKSLRILLFDNYDSFTWNVEHALTAAGAEVVVMRNDQLQLAAAVGFDGVVISPGPGLPEEAGELPHLLPLLAAHAVPTLGICLGMQAIATHFGATLRNLDEVLHGQPSQIEEIPSDALFEEIVPPMTVGLYHSWVVNDEDFPSVLEITARNAQGLPMAIRHRTLPIAGLQFHPESVLTPEGDAMLKNWLSSVRMHRDHSPAEPAGVPLWKSVG
jgi:anthranilate synthase component 2